MRLGCLIDISRIGDNFGGFRRIGCEGCYGKRFHLTNFIGFRTRHWWVEFPFMHTRNHAE